MTVGAALHSSTCYARGRSGQSAVAAAGTRSSVAATSARGGAAVMTAGAKSNSAIAVAEDTAEKQEYFASAGACSSDKERAVVQWQARGEDH